ncbi:hypothetical protein EVAR_56138_1 [Eumeta japonica]|uniref:Uncharacterized protein n=1 Tax=Eumeta variegata TaxID=151549 RepID=A0A4C1ZWJ7_EUMVA|nr:hypothetical protein EVAR_56138_1 [Eumeta japonica]
MTSITENLVDDEASPSISATLFGISASVLATLMPKLKTVSNHCVVPAPLIPEPEGSLPIFPAAASSLSSRRYPTNTQRDRLVPAAARRYPLRAAIRVLGRFTVRCRALPDRFVADICNCVRRRRPAGGGPDTAAGAESESRQSLESKVRQHSESRIREIVIGSKIGTRIVNGIATEIMIESVIGRYTR